MARAAFESALLKAPCASRNSCQSHPMLAGGTHRPLSNGSWITHLTLPKNTIFAPRVKALQAD